MDHVLHALFTKTPDPVIRGTIARGHLLTAAVPGWVPAVSSFGYQWLRDGKAITGATHAVYRIVVADHRHVIQVSVTGHRPGYLSTTATSFGGRVW